MGLGPPAFPQAQRFWGPGSGEVRETEAERDRETLRGLGLRDAEIDLLPQKLFHQLPLFSNDRNYVLLVVFW